MGERIVLLTLENINKYRRGKELLCHSQHCQRPLKVGDVIIAKQKEKHALHWHKDCYEKLFYGD
jgi:hypothetical protein